METAVHKVAPSTRANASSFGCVRIYKNAALFLLMAVSYVPAAKGQAEGAVITGSAGFLYSNNDGQTSVQPILTPVVLVPLGSHLLVETSAQLQGYIARSSANGPYEGQFFGTLQYLQLDWVVNSHLTVVAGRFTTPFNIYGERLGPMWLHNLQDAPLIYPIGTRTTGSSNGGMVRGVVVSRPTWLLNYTVFFSTLSEVSNLESGRAFGARTGIFLPRARLEVGTSYQRFLQDQHNDSYGAYFSWQPRSAPVDAKGEFLPMTIGGRNYTGIELFKAIEEVVYRVIDGRTREDLDLLWYLWSGPESPLFGKDRITTFERDFIVDKAPHHETKNPYFRLIHEVWFCDKILEEFGVNPAEGLIVNGHVPVAVEKGESPIKRSGKAITIDGAFSESYGDHGFTLVLEPHRTILAEHHHFESVEAAILHGADIIPRITVVREWDRPKRVADSWRGRRIKSRIKELERLIEAYRNNDLLQQVPS